MMRSCLWLLKLSLGVQALRYDLSAVGDGTLTGQAPSPQCLGSTKDRVLIFIPVCKHSDTMKLMTSNIDHLRTFEDTVSIDVFLAHYDGDRDSWLRAVGPWYIKNVQFYAEVPGLKMWLAKDLLLASDRQVQIDSYSYVWLLDEDAGLATLDVARMLSLARKSEANIVTPAFVNACWNCTSSEALESAAKTAPRMVVHARGGVLCQTGERMCSFQLPRSDCRYRYTNFVEVSFPLLKPAALYQVLGKCTGCMPSRGSTWGLNRVWCAVAASGFGPSERSCAIIDETPVVHYNFHTHPKSSKDRAKSSRAWFANKNVQRHVEQQFRDTYVHQFHTHQCVAR